MITEAELDALLGKPPAPVADNGFSHAVVAKITAEERAVVWFEWTVAAVLGVLVLVFAPWGRVAVPLASIAFDLSLSGPLAFACAALALSHEGLRWLEA